MAYYDLVPGQVGQSKSSMPVTGYTNDIGNRVYSAGGVYDSKGNPLQLNPINSQTLPGWYTTRLTPETTVKPLSSYIGTSSGGGGTQAPSAKDSAASAYGSSIATLLGGVDEARAAAAASKKHIASADADLNSARASAADITNSINAMRSSAMSLSPQIQFLDETGRKTSAIGAAILSGDTSGGGMAADYINSVRMAGDAALNITPDRYVSMAASDVQGAYDNSYQQMLRNMGRTGVSAGSGASMALQRQYAQSLATALAAAKTKAGQTGINEQLTALTNRASMFKDALATGTSLQQQGAENVAQAAGIIQKQGDMFSDAGSLGVAQTNAYANIGGVEVNLGQLELQSNSAVQSALDSVANAQQEMAKFYADQMTTYESGWNGEDYTWKRTSKS